MRARHTALVLVGALAAAALVAGCRQEEQDRLTGYKPGVYLGQKDTALNAGQTRALQERSALQAGIAPAPAGGTSGDVRPPAK